MKTNVTKLFLILWLALPLSTWGATTVVWEGNQVFSTWSDCINVAGSKFAKVKADDVLLFTLTAASNAQLQVSYGNSWTNFPGLEAHPVTGDYRMVVTSQTVSELKQGIHVKGVNYTLRSISIVSNDGRYTTSTEELFGWGSLLTSGATRGESSTVSLMPYGGAGWYWPETQDLSAYGRIEVTLLQPASETLIVQLLYGETGVKRLTIPKGGTSCRLVLTSQHSQAYSFSILSEKAQTVALGSVNLLDKQGRVVAVETLPDDAKHCRTTYYDIRGIRQGGLREGLNIVVANTEGGRTITRKVVK